jgi:hypothetical protein
VDGQDPEHPIGEAGSKWQMMVVVVVLVVVVVVVLVVVVEGAPTTSFSTGAQMRRGLPTGMLSSTPN